MVRFATVASLVLVAALPGCGPKGSSGSLPASAAAAAGSGSSSTSGSTFTGIDATPPTFTLGFPARGEFVSGAAQVTLSGTADDAESGVSRVEIDGQVATLNGNGWTLPRTLDFGLNIFAITVLDRQGNVARTTWSALYSPTYLPASQMVEDGAADRLSQRAIDRIAPIVIGAANQNGALQAAIAAAAGQSAAGLTIQSLSFGTPTVAVSLAQGGVRTIIDIPNLAVQASFLGINLNIGATNARVDATLDLGVLNGTFAAGMSRTPTVTFTGFTSTLGTTLQPLVEQALAAAIQSQVPPAVTQAMNQALQPQTSTVAGVTLTFEGRPRSLAIDPANFRGSGDANLTVGAGPNPRTGPGSISRNGASLGAPAFTTPHDVSIALREDLLNRGFYAAWASGQGRIRIDQAFLQARGVSLPFPLDAALLVPFFPALAALKPGGGPMPVAFSIDSLLPATVEVTGAPSLLTAGLGEQHLSIQIDLGQGYVDVLTVAIHAEIGASLQIQGNQLRILPGQPARVAVDLLQNPLGLSVPDVNRFLQTIVPMAVGLAATFIPPVTIPPLPFGLNPSNLDLRQDGPGADYVTLEGDL